MKTRVLHVTDCYDGGVYDSINRFAELCPEFEHYLIFAGRGKPPIGLFEEVTPFNSSNWMNRWVQLRSIFRKSAADVIHLHSSRAGALGRIIKTRTPVIFQPHGIAYEQEFSTLLKAVFLSVERALARRTDVFVAVSTNEQKQIERISNKDSIVIIPNSSKMPAAQSSSRKYVVSIGMIRGGKDPALFSQISESMRKIRPDLEFVWIGAGDEELEQLLRSGKVHVTGWLDKVEMAKFLSSTAVYVHTSKFEGFPIAVLDVANFQIPVLVRDIQAFRYVPLVKFSDHLDAVTKIQNLMSDENYYQELVGISQEIANSNSPSAQKTRYQKLIYELTKHE